MNGGFMKQYHQEVFQGNLEKKNYFEGWYYKQVTKDTNKTIVFIPGISTAEPNPHAFIQIIYDRHSYYISYDMKDFSYGEHPFFIKIRNNIFSLEHLILNIEEEDLRIQGNLTLSNITPLQKNLYRPNIMGPFAYLKHMECNHGIVSLNHEVNGTIKVNGQTIVFKDGDGYIEKDYGTSFPTYYTWFQSNTPIKSDKATIFLSIAHIPILHTSFRGLISVLEFDNKQYYFTSYYFSKIKQYQKDKKHMLITLKNLKYMLEMDIQYDHESPLIAPQLGHMNHPMKESVDAEAHVKLLTKKKKIIFEDTFVAGGLEDVQDYKEKRQ